MTELLMKAAIYHRFGGPIQVKEVPIPQTPQDGVLLQVKATGVCRSDWHGWKGHDSDIQNHGLPFCPGHELSGVVVKIGSQTKNFSIGDRVVVPFILSCGRCQMCKQGRATICLQQKQPGFTQWGSFAEYVALPRADRNLRKLPTGISFIQAAALGCRFTTAYRALIQQGQFHNLILKANKEARTASVTIFGCGGLGLSCIMIAAAAAASKMANIDIIAVDVSVKALQKAKELGATHIVQVAKDSSPQDIAKQVSKQLEGHLADITLDTAGFALTSEAAVYATKAGEKMIQVGLPHDRPCNIPMNIVAGKELELIGSHGFDAQDLPDLLELIVASTGGQKRMDPCQLVEKAVALGEGCKVLQNMDQQSPLGIVMITDFGNTDDDSQQLIKVAASRL